MTNEDLHAEIEALRREIAAMRAERPAGAAPEAAEATGANFTEQLKTLAHEIAEFTEDTEKGVVNHPLTSVLGALVLGLLIGRVLPR
jgi:ElaB/YqjD/DUF883 family membrane-anchored ribosome-binding protein